MQSKNLPIPTKRAWLICAALMSILYPSFIESRLPEGHGLQCLDVIDGSKKAGVFHNIYRAGITNPKQYQPDWLDGASRG